MFGGFLAVPPSLPNVFSFQLTRTFGFAPCSSSFFASSSAVILPVGSGGACPVLPTPAAPSDARLAQPRERVQRRPARVRRVRIRAALEQQRREIEIGVDDGHVERARAVGRDVIDVSCRDSAALPPRRDDRSGRRRAAA